MHVDKVEQILLSTSIRDLKRGSEQQTSEIHSRAHTAVLIVLLTMKKCLLRKLTVFLKQFC